MSQYVYIFAYHIAVDLDDSARNLRPVAAAAPVVALCLSADHENSTFCMKMHCKRDVLPAIDQLLNPTLVPHLD